MLFAQLSPSAEQLQFIRTWMDPVILPVIWFIVRKAYKSAISSLNGIITDNVNRIKEEISEKLIKHIDLKFKDHEESAFARLGLIETKVGLNESVKTNHAS